MRIVIIGAGDMGSMTARAVLDRGGEVIIIEENRERIESLTDDMSCGFLHGDGSKPKILKEAGPSQTDVLFCLTSNDLVNIVASVIGQSLGYERVVTRIEDPSYEGVCRQLGLKDTIVPNQTISRYLVDLTRGRDVLELSTMIRGEARFFEFQAGKEDKGTIGELDLPKDARAICFYRDDEFHLADAESHIQKGDRVIILTHSRHVDELRNRWRPQHAKNSGEFAERGGHADTEEPGD
ncbi:MAG: TrkA family potassium uptake protein [Phycisphaerae bacterium]|nr:TrkA family potassium uptake protein [Phycisphaerae bacterium]